MIPLDEEWEEISKITGVIDAETILVFKKDYYTIFAQLHQVGDFPPPSITPRALPPYKASSRIELALYDEEGERKIDVDDVFHEPLTFVYAEQLRDLDVGDDSHHKAIKAYLDALPDTARILLFWHGAW